jgi:HEPN domain-containing protein
MNEKVKSWYYYADKDMLVVSELMHRPDLTGAVAFHCQQAIEKYIKAFMVANDIPIIKTHELVNLNEIIKEIKDFGFDEDLLESLSQLYIEDRYPGQIGLLPTGEPTLEQAKNFYRFAPEVETKMKETISI